MMPLRLQVVVWGSDEFGIKSQQPAETQQPGGVRAIAAGANHALALLANGTVLAWGQATEGKTTVPAAATGASQLAAAYHASFALARYQGKIIACSKHAALLIRRVKLLGLTGWLA
jgi:alpha-tubulin suppressor-like RCC1 family protein